MLCLQSEEEVAEQIEKEAPLFSMIDNFFVIQLAIACYYIIMWLTYKATAGKLMVKLRVVDAKTHEKIKVWQAIVRYIGFVISTMLVGLGHVWIIFDKKKQALHDKLARTVVIEAYPKSPASPAGGKAPNSEE